METLKSKQINSGVTLQPKHPLPPLLLLLRSGHYSRRPWLLHSNRVCNDVEPQ